jgi:hypothetical protein
MGGWWSVQVQVWLAALNVGGSVQLEVARNNLKRTFKKPGHWQRRGELTWVLPFESARDVVSSSCCWLIAAAVLSAVATAGMTRTVALAAAILKVAAAVPLHGQCQLWLQSY